MPDFKATVDEMIPLCPLSECRFGDDKGLYDCGITDEVPCPHSGSVTLNHMRRCRARTVKGPQCLRERWHPTSLFCGLHRKRPDNLVPLRGMAPVSGRSLNWPERRSGEREPDLMAEQMLMAIRAADLTPLATLVLAEIVYRHRWGMMFPSHAGFAAQFGVTVRSIERAVRACKTAGYLKTHFSGRAGTRYEPYYNRLAARPSPAIPDA